MVQSDMNTVTTSSDMPPNKTIQEASLPGRQYCFSVMISLSFCEKEYSRYGDGYYLCDDY